MKTRKGTGTRSMLLGLLMAALAVPALAADGREHLTVNGQAVEAPAGHRAPHIHNDRLYVPAAEFAAGIGATYSDDPATGVVTISTGNGIPTLTQLKELNPKLAQYQALSPYIPNMGIHEGVMGPHITLAVSKEGTLNALELIVPAETGWFPWFDQPEGQAMELEGLGQVYTQHVYLTSPAGLVERPGVPVIVDGRYLSYGWEPAPHRHDGKVYIAARPAVEMLGGTIRWDGATRTASAALRPGRLTWEQLKALNPKIAGYQALSPFIPNMGIHMGVEGPGLMIMVDNAGKVTGAELVVPASTPWLPWYDQPEGQPSELPGLGQVWSQHVYLQDPGTIQ